MKRGTALAALLLAACGAHRHGGAIPVSIVAEDGQAEERALRGATGLGLLRLDEGGQLIGGVALRWALSDDARDGIFRIDDQPRLSAAQVATRLRAALRRLGGSRDVTAEAVTDAVVEVRSPQPRPDLLQRLATAEAATIAPGQGPFRLAGRRAGAWLLLPRPGADEEEDVAPVTLRADRPGVAVARFLDGRVQLVTGGTFASLPVARVATPRADQLRFDEATGLFGLAVTAQADRAITPPVVQALSLAVDRDRMVEMLGGIGTAKATTADGSTIEQPMAARRAAARAALTIAGAIPPVRVRLGDGPGARTLFTLLRADWAALGVATILAGKDEAADLALVDRVMPRSEQARAACAATAGCDPTDPAALLAPPFVPIMTPVRWSLVAPALPRFAANPLAAHPLDRLR